MFIQYPMAYTDTFPKEKKPKNTNYNINWTQTEKYPSEDGRPRSCLDQKDP